MRLKLFLRPFGSVTRTKHRNAGSLGSKCGSQFDLRRFRTLTRCYMAR